MTQTIEPTDKTTLKRIPKRGNFDRDVINAILDEAFICHVGFVADGQPFVIPTAYGRVGNELYIHGSSASRLMRSLANGVDVCVTVTLIDGLVLARSAFHHSINYRSIVIIGNAEMVTGDQEKRKALEAFTEHLIPNRWNDVRPPTELELKATIVLRLPIIEASAKMRAGDPVDDEEDYSRHVWAGVLPLALKAGEAIPDARLDPDIEPQEYVQRYKRF
ncbi:pyridoxamine 5'-phosphate oxidase family protein [soil metagenome]